MATMPLTRRKTLLALASCGFLSACGGDAEESKERIGWTQTRRRTDTDPLGSVCYGNTTFVAVGSADSTSGQAFRQAISYSNDGTSWTVVRLPVSGGADGGGQILSAAFGQGRFVVISSAGDIFTSVDGKVWTILVSDASAAFEAVAFGNDRFVIMGQVRGGWIATTWHSFDGLVWSGPVSSGIGFNLSPMKFVNGIAYAFTQASNTRMLWKSVDSGESWTQDYVQVGGKTVDVANMTYGKQTYVAATDAGDILTSTDAAQWTVRHRFNPMNYTNLAYLGDTFLLTNGQSILTSIDATSWQEDSVGQRGDILNSVAFDGRQFVAVGHPGLVVLGTQA